MILRPKQVVKLLNLNKLEYIMLYHSPYTHSLETNPEDFFMDHYDSEEEFGDYEDSDDPQELAF